MKIAPNFDSVNFDAGFRLFYSSFMRKQPIIGVVGLGMVGGQVKRHFEYAGFKRGKNLLCFDTDPQKKCSDDVSASTILFVCVPTPQKPDGSCDISIVERVVAHYALPTRTIVVKSTVEPATCERLARKYKAPILFNPEFLREASAWDDMVNPDRQIMAAANGAHPRAREALALLPKAPFSSSDSIHSTEAEIGKYACNTFGSLKVAFANVMADVCAGLESVLKKEGMAVPIAYESVRKILAHDRRIGDAWLNVNHGHYRGYGGYCFPKDTVGLIFTMRKIISRLPQKSRERTLLLSGVKVFEAMRDYNNALLRSQGLTEQLVSRHDHELEKKLKIKKA